MKSLIAMLTIVTSSSAYAADLVEFMKCSGSYEGQSISASILRTQTSPYVDLFVDLGGVDSFGRPWREELLPLRGIPGTVPQETYQSNSYQLVISRAQRTGTLTSRNDSTWTLSCRLSR